MQRLGRYELLRVVGRGGDGVVHEAVMCGADGLRMPVALKVLHRRGAARREARLGGLLRHRHLVDVYEVGEDGGQEYCAMELCRLGSLSRRLPLPPRAVVEVGLAVCDALGYAHRELGLVHLDLKPDNLLVDEAGVVKVADLGTARADGFGVDGGGGTRGYMAPEQVRGAAVDARADVYALGMTLIALATGAPLGAVSTMDPSTAALDGAPTQAPDGPAWLLPVVARCLEPEADDRWPDMAALAGALRALVVAGPGLEDVFGRSCAMPARPDAFVGRTQELVALATLLQSPGLFVLKGPAGIGKTRLAREATERWRASTGRPVFVCDVSEVQAVDGLVRALAASLDVPLGNGGTDDAVVQLGHAIGGRGPIAVVVDGADRLAAAVPVLEAWRRRAADARVVVTSRTALRLPSARGLEVGPLAPADATALLVRRAGERGVELDADPSLARLAARLDGLPLALELAAGRLGVLTVPDVLVHLDLSFLRRGTHDRHGTLRAALDWSWEALSDPEQSALAQASVFSGGFTAEAAEQVLDLGGKAVRPVLEALVDRSMVSPVRERGFRLLAGIREYATERLGDASRIAERHARWFAATASDDALERLDVEAGARARLTRELDNLISACRWAVAHANAGLAVRLLQACWLVTEVQGPADAVVLLGESVVDVGGLSASDRAAAELVLGAALLDGRHGAARVHLEAALAASREIGDRRREGLALGHLATLRWRQGDLDEARASFEAAHALLSEAGDRHGAGGLLGEMGSLQREQGRVAEARACFEAALAVLREVGDRRAVGKVLANLGTLDWTSGRIGEARSHWEAALALHREVGNRRSEGVLLGNLGGLHGEQGRMDEAQAHYEAALALHREVGSRRSEGIALGNLGLLHAERGRVDEARAHHEAALVVQREVGNRRSEGIVLGHLGALHDDLGRPDEARAHYEAALAIHRDQRDRRSEGIVLGCLGALHHDQGRIDEAWAHGEAALAVHREVGNRRQEGTVLGHLGVMHYGEGRIDEARAHLGAALVLHRQVDNRRDLALALAVLVCIAAATGDPATAIAHLEEAESTVTATDDAAVPALLCVARAGAATLRGDRSTARARLAEAEEAASGHADVRRTVAYARAVLAIPIGGSTQGTR